MNITRLLAASVATVLLAGCSSFTRPSGEALPKDARWGLVPLANYAQAPMAGDRAAQILVSVLGERGIRPQVYDDSQGGNPTDDEKARQRAALDWARQQNLQYVLTGSVDEWQYKNGLDGEPAVGVTLQVVEPASGRVVWSNSGA
ncbi:MAG TPA: penicillin-binding protein activator LpoB, partial [Pseudomonas sp.]|nr:penicillin-binding protein activator LpoB [Pseudomonas sp.]